MALWRAKSRPLTCMLRHNLFGSRSTASSRSVSPLTHPFPTDECPPSTVARTSFLRFKSTATESQLETAGDYDEIQLEFPGGKVNFTPEMRFIPGTELRRIPCYRVLDEDGNIIPGSDYFQVREEMATKMYNHMVRLQIMDSIFYEAQRQGRISFYMTSIGEEAINVASAAALTHEDVVLPQYREPGVLQWRGFTVQDFANQCFGNKDDIGKGKQMPMHYGCSRLNYITVSSPIATQLPQAAGVAYSLKMDGKDACVVTYIGDGGTSEGDFHAALNFAAVMEAPVVFFCRNNGWAISTHISEQFRSDGIVVKGQAYGIRAIRVDGNDALAVYSAVREAREYAVKEHLPVLVEALTYRVGHHSTSDDSTKYREMDEIEYWKIARDPVNRFKRWMERKGWWSEERDRELRTREKEEVRRAIQKAEKSAKPPVTVLFSDVYDAPTQNLLEQEQQLRKMIHKYPNDYPNDVPV